MSHVISLGKTRLLAGLYWSCLQSSQKNRKVIKEEVGKLASEFANVHEADPSVGAVHSTGIDLLLGVGAQPDSEVKVGTKEKINSLACLALTANPTSRSFVGRLHLSDGKEWIVVIRSGLISPVGDLVVDKDESENVFSPICQRNDDLPVLFDETQRAPSDELIRVWLDSVTLRKVAQVKGIKDLGAPPVNSKMLIVYGVAGAVLIGGVYAGYAQYQGYVEQKESQAAAARRAAMEKISQSGEIPTPWEEWADVSTVAAACLSHYLKRDDYKYGWEAVSWQCNGSQVTQKWHRTDVGSYSHLPVEEGFSLSSPNEITNTQDLDFKLTSRGNEGIPPKNEVAKILMDAARIHGMAIRLEWGSEETRTYMQGGGQKVESLGYALNTATISGKGLSRLTIVQTLGELPGLRLKGMSEEGSKFEIKVEFYTAV